MSYAAPPPVIIPAPAAAARRPAPVTFASVLLIGMAMVGLGYAIATLAIAPGTIERFRRAAGSSAVADVDGFVTVVWIGAAVSAVLAVILFALSVVLALGLRRGSNAARVATWVVAGLGLLAGCGSTLTVAVQRGGDPAQDTLGAALTDAYPGGWIGLNVTLSVAQMLGYLLVAILLLASPGTFFGRAPKPLPPDPFAAPPAPYGHPGGYPGAYPPPPAGYGPPAPGGYSAPPPGGYGAPYPSTQPPASPAGPPQPGPDDQYWARPSG